jgi:hypothetical protein
MVRAAVREQSRAAHVELVSPFEDSIADHRPPPRPSPAVAGEGVPTSYATSLNRAFSFRLRIKAHLQALLLRQSSEGGLGLANDLIRYDPSDPWLVLFIRAEPVAA